MKIVSNYSHRCQRPSWVHWGNIGRCGAVVLGDLACIDSETIKGCGLGIRSRRVTLCHFKLKGDFQVGSLHNKANVVYYVLKSGHIHLCEEHFRGGRRSTEGRDWSMTQNTKIPAVWLP